ncbi:unnamed protein product [Candida verbasci]|uniref:Vacuolar protein sorting-associated protein 28 n=1 Tax=Candida verbasci TaxID=1227364 RepID=A0A9W4TVE3_9ASCO|nr:unnamed protein product [Candida verbasci]
MNSNSPPEYAPISTSSFTVSSSEKYNKEITKHDIIKSPELESIYNSLTEIYSILPTLEMVESSYMKDYITNKETYTNTAYRLINQYQIILKTLENKPELNQIFPGLKPDNSNFLSLLTSKYNLNYPLALRRIEHGLPSTIENISVSGGNGNGKTRLIAEITGNFITCMDAIKLNYNTKNQLHPLLSELVINLNEFNESLEFNGKSKLINWLIRINNLEKQFSNDDLDLFLKDLDVAYKGFYSSLDA